MDILLLAVGAALVNNVILSQFLGLCPFLGVSKNVNTAAGSGCGCYLCYDDCICCNKYCILWYFIQTWTGIPEYDCIYSCDCCACTVCRNVFKEKK